MRIDTKRLNWGALSAVIALVLLVGYEVLAPRPGAVDAKPPKSKSELQREKQDAMADLAQSEQTVKEMTWQIKRDEIGPSAMAWISEKGKGARVDVSAFRPQRAVDAEGLSQLNYLVTAEGPYLNVMAFLKEFEGPDSLLTVKTLQLASIDGASDTVRATVALSTYQEVEVGG